jgi:hypothetical protein
MEKEEAIVVLRDVLNECAGSLLARCVLLEPVAPKTLEDYGHYEVHIACMVDDDLRRCVNIVVSKHKLALRQKGNVLILYRPKA